MINTSRLLKSGALAVAVAWSVPAADAQVGTPYGGGVWPSDYNFVMQAAFGGWSEVAAGQVAEQDTGNPTVQNIGAMMIADHTRANQQLAELAAARGITAPTTPDPGRQGVVEMLREMIGEPDFAQAYIGEQIPDHLVAIALYQAEATSSLDPGLRAFAQQTLPIVQHHLQVLEAASASPIASAR